MAKREETWEQREARRKKEQEEKQRDTKALVAQLDTIIEKAIRSGAYHTGEVERLSNARHMVFSVRAGVVQRRR